MRELFCSIASEPFDQNLEQKHANSLDEGCPNSQLYRSIPKEEGG